MLFCYALLGCAATGPYYSPEPINIANSNCVVYRINQAGATMGTWVSTRLEINGSIVGKLPDQSFVAFSLPTRELTLSATDMVNFRYADGDRMTLRHQVVQAEIAYFRLTSVFGSSCAAIQDFSDGEVAYTTHRFRPDSPQTSCFQRVPEALALKELKTLRRAD